MLLERAAVLPYLRCPKSRSPLIMVEQRLQSVTDPSFEYRILGDLPVLINFRDSIVNEEMLMSDARVFVRPKHNSILRKVVRRIISNNNVAKKNILHIVNYLKREYGDERLRILIIGGGKIGEGLESLYSREDVELIAFDIYLSDNIQFIADAHQLPFDEQSFDCVISQAILEHVVSPQQVATEIHRVLKCKGMVYAETPFLQHIHEGPYDFTRFTESGHRYLFRKFEAYDSGIIGGLGTQFVWSIDYLIRGIFRSKRLGQIARLFFFWFKYLDLIIPSEYNRDGASGFFFIGIKSEYSISQVDLIQFYKGAQ
jgi:hypothetical protein